MTQKEPNIDKLHVDFKDDGFTKAVGRVASVPAHVEARRLQEREKDPVKFCAWITKRPKTWFCEYNLQSLAVVTREGMILASAVIEHRSWRALFRHPNRAIRTCMCRCSSWNGVVHGCGYYYFDCGWLRHTSNCFRTNTAGHLGQQVLSSRSSMAAQERG